jgi:hypothetical protein
MDIGLGIILLFDISGHSCVDDDLELWKQRICRNCVHSSILMDIMRVTM